MGSLTDRHRPASPDAGLRQRWTAPRETCIKASAPSNQKTAVTDRIAYTILLVLLLAAAFDYWQFDGQAVVFLLREFNRLVEYLAFWR